MICRALIDEIGIFSGVRLETLCAVVFPRTVGRQEQGHGDKLTFPGILVFRKEADLHFTGILVQGLSRFITGIPGFVEGHMLIFSGLCGNGFVDREKLEPRIHCRHQFGLQIREQVCLHFFIVIPDLPLQHNVRRLMKISRIEFDILFLL